MINKKFEYKTKQVNTKYVSCGVPQGTILGLLLSILYVNDLLRDMPEGSILFYADNTVIMFSEDTWSMTQDKINQLLDQVAKWLAFNKLSLNIQKNSVYNFW